MHIRFCIYQGLDILTGGFLYDRFLVEALRQRGHRVEVIPLEWKAYGACLLDNLDRRRYARILDPGCDLILQDALCHPSLLGLNRRLRLAGAGRAPVVSIVHQVLCRQPRHRLLNRFYALVETSYLKSVDGFLFNSAVTQRQVLALLGGQAPHRVALPGGDRLGSLAAEALIAERSSRSGPLELLFVGNISPIKGLSQLLESLGPLPSSMWRLTVVGSLTSDGRCARRIQSQATATALAQRVRFLGAVDGERLREVFTRSQVFAMPFAHEGFGIAALEAMAFGLPVIGSAAGGVGEFVRHGHNGFLVAPGEYEAVRRHIRALHADRQKLAEASRNALNTFRERPTWAGSMSHACDFLEAQVPASGWKPESAGNATWDRCSK